MHCRFPPHRSGPGEVTPDRQNPYNGVGKNCAKMNGRRRSGAAHDPIYCPVNATLNLLNARWTLHIVRTLLEGKKRFNEIARANGINPRTLRARLRELEEEGAVRRTVISSIPPNVEYELTEKGLALNCIIEALAQWGQTWMKPPDPNGPRGCCDREDL